MKDNLYHLTAFPQNTHGGNKAGVYLFADHLSDVDMQNIAKDVGYSETAFVMNSDVADFKVRFFSPSTEVDLCGHATIATFNLLRDLDIIEIGAYTQETKAGILTIQIEKNRVFMQQNQPIFSEFIPSDELSSVINLKEINQNFEPQVVSTGLREIFVAIKNITILNHFKPDFKAMSSLLNQYQAVGMHLFCLDKDVDAYGRNFAPILGINEESATGTSNGALACYLYRYWKKKDIYQLRQGYSMNQPSQIEVRLEIKNDDITSVWVGGKAEIIK